MALGEEGLSGNVVDGVMVSSAEIRADMLRIPSRPLVMIEYIHLLVVASPAPGDEISCTSLDQRGRWCPSISC